MKIRTDFVSNSSSSSFVLWGARLAENEIVDALKVTMSQEKYDSIRDKWMPTYDEFIEELNNNDYDHVYEILEMYFSTIVHDSEYHEYYVGESPSSMKDDETLLQFKTSISNKLNELLGKQVDQKIEFYTGVDEDGFVSLA